MITQADARELFDYRDGYLYWKRPQARGRIPAGARVGCPSRKYWVLKLAQKCMYAHRVIWAWHYGDVPDLLDHINQDPLDNRIENLRPASKQQNAVNTSHRRGVCRGTYFNRQIKKWAAQIKLGGLTLYLGSFDTQADAKAAYDSIAKEWFGDFYQELKK